jgi:DNA-binding CsgD family transcriptional regulator
VLADGKLRAFSRAAAELYGPGLDAGVYLERAFRFIAALAPNDLSGHGSLDTESKQLSASFDRSLSGLQPCLEAFGRLMHKYPPFRFDPSVNGGRPYSISGLMGKSAFRDLDVYQEVHRPLGFDDHCFVHVPSRPGLNIFFGLFRERMDFDESDTEILALSQPLLASARRLAAAQTAAADVPVTPDLFESGGFTPRECEAIFWLTQGKANIEIAHLMRIRVDTLSDYLRTVYEKMGVENRVAATIRALAIARRSYLQAERIQEGAVSFRVRAAQR